MRKNIFGVRIAFAIVLLFFGFIGGYYLAHKSEQEATHALCQSDKNDHAQAQQGGIPSLNTGEYHLILGDNQIDALNTNLANLSFQGCPKPVSALQLRLLSVWKHTSTRLSTASALP